MGPLTWIGARAQWALAIGVVSALMIPGPGLWLDGTIPFWVALLTGLAMTRIDLRAVAKDAVRPRRLLRTLGLCVLLMGLTPAFLYGLCHAIGLDPDLIAAIVYTASAPPLGSATAFCLILGLNAAFALEITVLGSFLAPLSMPIVTRALLGEAVPLDLMQMFARLVVLIGSAAAGAILARAVLGAKRIDKHARAFDGLATICLVMFLFPLFQGLTARLVDAPVLALSVFALVLATNLGIQIASLPLTWRIAGRETGGATSLMWGNRNAALALASLPADPILTLYVALYQFPMYFTPLLMRPFIKYSR